MSMTTLEKERHLKLNAYQLAQPKKAVLVLIYYKFFSRKFGYLNDSIMISVNKSSEIYPEFLKCMKILQRDQIELKWFKPSNNKIEFDSEKQNGRKTA